MAYVKYSNGVRCEWDENISVGTLIRTYYSGYWILERIKFREPHSRDPALKKTIFDIELVEWSHDDMKAVPIFHFCQVLNDDGKPTKKNRKMCDASYCVKVDRAYMKSQAAREHALADAKAIAIAAFL
jgi:hypothetical protein